MSIILFSEIRLDRNVKGYNFPSTINKDEALEITEKVEYAIRNRKYKKFLTSEMSSLDKLKHFEENGAGDIFKHEDISSIFISDEDPAVMVNGTNHISIFSSSEKLDLKNLYERVSRIDDLIDANVDYAYREDFGYLTANPQMCGTAMDVTIYFHLPATAYFGISSLVSSLSKLGYKVSTLSSGAAQSVGSIYKISHERVIGLEEMEYIDKLLGIAREIVDIEEQNRKKLYLDKIIELEDIVNRAVGVLSHCRIISEEEMINKMSDLFLGMELSILKPKKNMELLKTINSLKNGHLQIERGSLLDEKSRNILRANNIRKMMKEVF
ncbi:ATP--guanido phosphotransferase [Peptoniphilus sp. oral taxon 386]|uniref:ATP--guanido phosphotransferase n=1 Tax=Peptoniphilus sp. oral taxon 386 TaxID=652713 RepID=UPI0001DAA432|nr:ATP--guanido phosphotransferase [Peptoniphilus sp. oral taxon 386]EFI41344.1 ATP:guanido phosphotransferase, C-terminal catalytic domain protein [Peptoniphilus sp. oral taxon 386 str. F0131]